MDGSNDDTKKEMHAVSTMEDTKMAAPGSKALSDIASSNHHQDGLDLSGILPVEVDPANKDNILTRVQSTAASENPIEYPPMKKAVLILLALYSAVFLIALDRTIIGTAIPKITNDFNSFDDIGWYGSAYLLTAAGFQLFFGRVYTFYSPKWVYISAITLFEVGSALCGAAPNSPAFIIGRAIAGIGCAGMLGGAIVLVMNVLPLEKRPFWLGLNGAVFGIASVVGPLLGGVFTTDVSWRWCFYINLPFGAVTIVVVLFVYNVDRPMAAAGKTFSEKFWQLDPLGTICFLPGIICLLLALQWGGSTYAWSNGRIIALFVLFVILIGTFIALQIFRDDDNVTIPTRVITNRSIFGGFWFATFSGSTLILATLYIPIWFQAIEGVDAVESGIRSIPLVLALVVAAIMTGISISKVGYYTPFAIAGACIQPIGAGLLTTLHVNSGHAQWIGYQVLLGFGLGMGQQQPGMAAQTVLSRRDVPAGISMMMLAQSLGGAIFASVGQNVLDNKLIGNLRGVDIPGFTPQQVVNAGATNLRNLVPPEYLPVLLVAYNDAITKGALAVCVATSSLVILGALCLQWRSVKKAKQQQAAAAKKLQDKKDLSAAEKGEIRA